MTDLTLILASSSPRRRELLAALGVGFAVRAVDVDERRLDGESADRMVVRLAEAKATARASESEIVLGADTAVVLDDEVFGKPRHRDDALTMLATLSGRRHRVVTGVAVASGGRVESRLSSTEVQFREIDPDEALRYWQTGEPRDKAGAYAIQGLGGVFVEAIIGSYSGVVGLPVFETAALLARAGVDVLVAQRQ